MLSSQEDKCYIKNITKEDEDTETYNESSSTRQLIGSTFNLFEASINLTQKFKIIVQKKYYFPKNWIKYNC